MLKSVLSCSAYVFGFIFVAISFVSSAPLNAQSFSDSVQTAYFDPEHDPVLALINGKVRFVVSEDVLVRATDLRFTKIGQIESVYKKQLYDEWYVFMEGREQDHIEQSVVVVLRLRKDENDRYFADHFWNACVGNSCGSCGFDETRLRGCFCKSEDPSSKPGAPGFCYNIWSDETLFRKVPLKAP